MKVGTVCYCTDQGLGMLAKSFFDAGVITDPILIRHPKYLNHPEWYPPDTPVVTRRIEGPLVDEVLQRVSVMLFFETPFDWSLVDRCRKRGIRTVLMPMYEWSLQNPPCTFDKYLCPSLLDVEYFPGHPFIVPPVDPSTWRCRQRALHFIHNAGHIGHRNHKGTEELLKAIPLLRPEIRLTIRSQTDKIYSLLKGGTFFNRLDIQVGDLPYEKLFSEGDVYVAPEKFNGLSLPLQEACAAGMLVMASDRYPTNTWLPQAPLIPVESFHSACVAPSYNRFLEAEITPKAIAETMNDWYGRDIEKYSLAGREWAKQHSWAASKQCILEALSS